MRLTVEGRAVLASDAGAGRDPARPLVILMHGAGMDRSVWAGVSRGLPGLGYNVAAVDLPGHGGSEGPALREIGAMADWALAVSDAAGAERVALVGHSMGALIALAAAARAPERVTRLVLVGAAARMAVHPDLLAAARDNALAANDMVSLWSLGAAARGGCPTPGAWMLGLAQALLARSAPGVLHADLAACDGYLGASEAAARVTATTTLISGERDLMAPIKGARALAAMIPQARLAALPGAGHLPMIEAPRETAAALKAALAV